MFRFIFSRTFLIQLVLALLLIGLCIGGTYYFLLSYTKLGEAIEVPDLTGFDLVEVEATLKPLNLSAEVIDSIYLADKRGGEVTDQTPIPTSLVKSDRKIYLTVTRYSTPMVELPDVKETIPIAIAKLNSYGFEVVDMIPRPAECDGCAIGVEVNGKEIEPGAKLPKGQKVNLIIGETGDAAPITVPMAFGLTLREAEQLLHLHSLDAGIPIYDSTCTTAADSAAARVYRQKPVAGEKIQVGSSIFLYFSSDLSLIPDDVNIDSIKAAAK